MHVYLKVWCTYTEKSLVPVYSHAGTGGCGGGGGSMGGPPCACGGCICGDGKGDMGPWGPIGWPGMRGPNPGGNCCPGGRSPGLTCLSAPGHPPSGPLSLQNENSQALKQERKSEIPFYLNPTSKQTSVFFLVYSFKSVSLSHTHSLSCTPLSLSHTHIHSLSHALFLTHTHTLSHTHIHYLSHTLSHTHTPSHTLSLSHALFHTHSISHAHIQSLSHTLSHVHIYPHSLTQTHRHRHRHRHTGTGTPLYILLDLPWRHSMGGHTWVLHS